MTKFKHVMLDLESLSRRTNAALIQITAVAFDIETGELGPRFNAYVDETSLNGATVGHVEINTVAWWMQQQHAQAMGTKLSSEDEALPLSEALCAFEGWYCDEVAEFGCPGSEEISLWAKGLKDFAWLEAAFERTDLLPVPWHHRSPRDARTLFLVAPGGQPRPPKDETRAHDAQYDCEYQIAQVVEAARRIRESYNEAFQGLEKSAPMFADLTPVYVDEQGGTHNSPEAAL